MNKWSGINRMVTCSYFNAFAVAMVLSPLALWKDRSSLPIAYFCLLTFATMIGMFVFSGSHWVEWLPVTMFLAFPPFIGFLLRSQAKMKCTDRV